MVEPTGPRRPEPDRPERDRPDADHPEPGPPAPSEGGDPACWLDQVCPACGRLTERRPDGRCAACGEPWDRD